MGIPCILEEPRQRLTRAAFSQLERAHGAFTRFLGPERGHAASTVAGIGGPDGRVHDWFHPTFATVGSALRLLHERAALSLEAGVHYRALALVPDSPGAAWQS
jgi:hypothetical protein